jgi:hypothetical protein
VARNAFALAILVSLALSGCSKLDNLPFLGNKKAKAAEARAAAMKVRADSIRKARKTADSLAVVRHAACVDSVRAELSKPVPVKKTKGRGKRQTPAPSPELIATQAQTTCEQAEAARQPVVAAKPMTRDSTSTPASAAQKDTAARAAIRDTAVRPVSKDAISRALPGHDLARIDSTRIDSNRPRSDQTVWADSVRKAKETEMSRETFAYSGGTRDPFASLLNMAKAGPEVADLQLVGIYRNLRSHSGSVAVFRERETGKRHRLRTGDQLGRSKLMQIRERDVVFMIEDFGFERQETLSLRKQEDVIP